MPRVTVIPQRSFLQWNTLPSTARLRQTSASAAPVTPTTMHTLKLLPRAWHTTTSFTALRQATTTVPMLPPAAPQTFPTALPLRHTTGTSVWPISPTWAKSLTLPLPASVSAASAWAAATPKWTAPAWRLRTLRQHAHFLKPSTPTWAHSKLSTLSRVLPSMSASKAAAPVF